MSLETPMIRVNWTRMTLDFWKQRLPPEILRGALDAVGLTTLARLDEAGPLEWLPAEHHVRVAVAPAPLLRPLEYRKLWCQMVLASFERPLFRVIAETAMRSFKKTPGDMARLIPRSWTLVGRGMGEMAIMAETPRLTIVTCSKLPALLRAAPDFSTAWLGALDAFYELSAHQGSVEMNTGDLAAGRVVYTMRW